MTALTSENFETVAPTEADALLARESSRRLATHKLGKRSSIRIQLLDDGEEAETVAVPRPPCACSCICSPRCPRAMP